MAIYRPSKSGDAMGSDVGRRPGKKQRSEYGKIKRAEEEKRVLEDPREVKQASSGYKKWLADQQKTMGL